MHFCKDIYTFTITSNHEIVMNRHEMQVRNHIPTLLYTNTHHAGYGRTAIRASKHNSRTVQADILVFILCKFNSSNLDGAIEIEVVDELVRL